jgi:hypothetical protein
MSTTATTRNGKGEGALETVGGTSPTNDAEESLVGTQPQIVHCVVRGVSPILFHRWSNEAVAEKAAAAKNSAAKKTDNVESYVYRDTGGRICLPGEYLRMALVMTAKFKQDPRSPRKSMFDLAKAAIVTLTELAPMKTEAHPDGCTDWDYLDARRVTVQRAGVTRQRPAFNPGWAAEFSFLLNLPQYIGPTLLHELLVEAGRVTGVGDFRPTYGRFQVVRFETGFDA